VFGGNGAAWRERARQGQFLALDPLIKRDLKAQQLSDYVEAQYKVYSYPGVGQFALPMYMATFALFYNKGVFRERGVAPPDDTWDWTKWQDAMQRLTVRPDAFGAWLLTFSRSRANMLVLQNGGHFVDPKDDTVCVADQPACIDALQWLNDRYWRDHTAMQQGDAQAAGGTSDTTLEQLFSTGKVAMFMHGSFRLAPLTFEVQPGVEWDCTVLPKGKVKRSSRASTDGWGIWKGSKNPDDAWDFLKWLQGDEWYDIMMGTVGLTPARVSQVDKWTQAIVREYPALAGKNLRAFTDPIKQRWAEPEEFFRVHKDAADILDAAFTDSVRDNKTSVAAAMKEAAKRITDVEKQLAGQ
jgi:ABC-type glycerol-3-phosphate transport system substrate-binding protein